MEAMRAELIERGKKFVSLAGVNYEAYHGLAYANKKRRRFGGSASLIAS